MSDAGPNRDKLPEYLDELLREESGRDRAALERVWQVTGEPMKREPSDGAFAQMGSEIWANLEREVRRSERPARPRPRRAVWRWTAVSASLVAVLLVGVLYLTAEKTYTAPAGDRIALRLPDGSRVELNSGASLTFAPRTFGWFSRTTSLVGEAFFEVVPRESEFVARTFNAEVRVLGTSFNVRAWPGEGGGETVVALHTGRVRLSSRTPEARAVVLRPGQMSRVESQNAAPTHPEATDLNQALAWRTGRFVFVDAPLSEILAEMERRFDVSIRADADEVLDDRLTLAYDEPTSAETILEDIASSYSRYRYRRISGGYELYVPER